MAKLTVNIGQSANDRQGDNLRTAFNKINENFDELYTALGLDSDTTLNLGNFVFEGNTVRLTNANNDDSTATTIEIAQPVRVESDLTVGGDVVPSTDFGSSLGSPTKRFKDLYISNNTIFLGNTSLGVSSGGDLTVGGASVSSVIDYNDIQNKPNIELDSTGTGDVIVSSGNVLPATDNTQYLGSASNRWHSLYVGPGSINLGGAVISNTGGVVALPGVNTVGYRPSEINGGAPGAPPSYPLADSLGTPFTFTDVPVIIDQVTYGLATGQIVLAPGVSYTRATYTATMSNPGVDGTVDDITITDPGSIYPANENFETINTDNMWALPAGTDLTDLSSINSAIQAAVAPYGVMSTCVTSEARSVTSTSTLTDFSTITGTPTTLAGYGITDAFDGAYSSLSGKPTIPADVGDLTDTGGLLSGVDLTAFSVGAEAAASGDGGIAYNNSTGVFTYTPPDLSGYQTTLVSGTSIKTINGTSLLGSGNVTISASGADLSAVNQNYTPDTDNAYDLGIAAGNFLRTGYFKTSVVIGTGEFTNATLTYNANGHLQSSAGINTSGFYSDSYMSFEPKYGGLIFWMDGDPSGGTLGYSNNNGSNELTWSGDLYSNGPTYQLDKDKANLQIGAEVTKTISGVTLGATTSLSFSDPYYFNPNSTVTITGVVGTTELNNQTYFIDSSGNLYTDAALTTPLNSSAFTAYVSGGTAVVAPRATMSLPVLHSPPSSPTNGMMAIADGTNWNPVGLGNPGFYIYYNGQWWLSTQFVI
jgi:hypothetical protein